MPEDYSAKTVQVVWILNQEGNTGTGGLLGELLGRQCRRFTELNAAETDTIKPKSANVLNLQQWCSDNGFVEHKCDLLAQLGLYLKCFAKPFDPRKEHRGKNNILATFLTCRASNGLAPNTVLGKAVVMRTTKYGEPVDLSVKELLRCLLFVNDMMDLYSEEEHIDAKTSTLKPQVLAETAAVFPYYWFNDTLIAPGYFQGAPNLYEPPAEPAGKEDGDDDDDNYYDGPERYCQALTEEDGAIVFEKRPPDMQIAPTFVL